jgi:hypothetical protein
MSGALWWYSVSASVAHAAPSVGGTMRSEKEIRALIALLMERLDVSADRARQLEWGSDEHREAMRAMDVCDYQMRALRWVVGDVPAVYYAGVPG